MVKHTKYEKLTEKQKREYLKAKGNPLLRISKGLAKQQADRLTKGGKGK